jgi:hypothetical protein
VVHGRCFAACHTQLPEHCVAPKKWPSANIQWLSRYFFR